MKKKAVALILVFANILTLASCAKPSARPGPFDDDDELSAPDEKIIDCANKLSRALADCDYGKFKDEQLRKEKEAKKKQKTVEIKEIRLSPNIDTNDLNTKVNAAKKFLEKGNRVKITLRFRGREMAHMGASVHILTDFAQALRDVAVVEKQPKVEGRSMTMFLAEKKN